MIKDWAIVAWITVIACWPFSLALIAISAGILLYKKHRVLALLMAMLFALTAVGAWQFERYM